MQFWVIHIQISLYKTESRGHQPAVLQNLHTMLSLFKSSALLLLTVSSVFSVSLNYYWRDYDGTIPDDAVVGGLDANESKVYIGQAYIRDGGLIPVQINPGILEVYAPYGGIHKVDNRTKILCGPEGYFHWVEANGANLENVLSDNLAVPGGQEDSFGPLNIGRIDASTDAQIGKVDTFRPEDHKLFYYNNNGKEAYAKEFEVLVYRAPKEYNPH